MTKAAVTKKEEGGALAAVPDYLKEDMESDAGNENVGKDDVIIPRLLQSQGLSPQIDKDDPKYIKGLDKGRLFNSLTGEIYPEITVICCFAFEKSWPIFKKRSEGGGFGGVFRTEKEAAEEVQLTEKPNAYEIQETAVHWALVRREDKAWDEVAIHMSSTKLTTSKQLNTLIKMRKGARWSHLYELSSKSDEISGKGKFHRLMAANHEGYPPESVVIKAREYNKTVLDSTVKTEYGNEDSTPESNEF